MRRTHVAVMTLVGSLLVAACNGDSTTTSPPRGTPQAGPSRTALALSCSNALFATMTSDAKAYLPAKDPVLDSIPVMKKLFGTSALAATPIGFQMLSHTADIRDAGLQKGSAAAGGKFVLDVVGCMSVGPVDDTFKPDQALDKGVLEVRGNADALAALAKVAVAGQATGNASPLWGAEPNGNWSRSGQPRYLVYGYPLGLDVRTSGFEMGTVPQSISRPPTVDSVPGNLFRVGLCIHGANANNTAANRLFHSGAIVTGLFDPFSNVDQGASFCSGNVIASTANSSWAQRLASSALALLSPKSAFAMELGDLGIGGLPDGWSPIVPNAIPGASIGLTFDAPIPNTFADTAFTVGVTVTDASGNAMPGVVVTISVDNNHGVPAGAVTTPPIPTGTTGLNGKVSISLSVGKAGGYILAAGGSISGVPTQTKLSNQFQVQNK